MENRPYDIAIIGGGIIGLATGIALTDRSPRCRVAVLEKESELARHQTGHNSGVIHAGIYYRPGSYKARLCVQGVRLMTEFCDANGIAYERCGKVIVATTEAEVPRLLDLYERGNANGVPGLVLIEPEQLRELEPHARAVRALHSPSTAIVDFGEVARTMGASLESRGVPILTGAGVTGVKRDADLLHLETGRGTIAAHNLINCAGLYSDVVARAAGARPDVRIVPFRGEYYVLKGDLRLVRGLIYPVPDPAFPFLGVHFTKRIHGSIEAGPNAVLAFAREGYRMSDVNLSELLGMATYRGFWTMAGRYWRTGLGEYYRSLRRAAFLRALQRLVPELEDRDMEPGGSGVRAQAVRRDGTLLDDFEIATSPNAIHVLNSPSPAATASLAIGRHIADLAAQAFDLPISSAEGDVRSTE